MSFDNPAALLALLALPLIPILDARRFSKRAGAFFALVGRRALTESLNESGIRRRAGSSSLFFALALASALLALSGPRWGVRLIPEYRRGLDVALAVDVSRSMDAADAFPTRLGSASRVARAFVEASPGIRFSVVIGKGAGVVAVPMTDDAESVLGMLSAVSSGAMSSRGTDLERLLDAALDSFPASASSRRLVVLFSDGEALAGDTRAAAERASASGIRIAAVGFGTAEGSFVPAAGDGKAALRDGGGVPVRSSLKESALSAVSAGTGGRYFDGSRPDTGADLTAYASELSSVAAADGFRKEPMARYPVFLLAALGFFFASKLSETVSKRRPR